MSNRIRKPEKYKQHLITIIDVLGFSNIVEKKTARYVYSILETLSQNAKYDELFKEYYMQSHISFSDTIIRTICIPGNKHLSFLPELIFGEIYTLCLIFINLIGLNIPVRGAMVIDNAFIDESYFFGSGIIEAVKEEKKAKYPRIVIKNSVIEKFNKENKKLVKSVEQHFDLVNFTYDGYRSLGVVRRELELHKMITKIDKEWSIDYLKAGQYLIDDAWGYSKFLLQHKKMIKTGLKNKEIQIKEKYEWMQKYHNDFINKNENYNFSEFSV